jgi:hypothetical protein
MINKNHSYLELGFKKYIMKMIIFSYPLFQNASLIKKLF